MNDTKKITLSIEENAKAFLNEAIDKVLQASNDARHWQFAILHLVQALELSLKSLLKKVHPIFVYEDVDNPKNMISLRKAIQRLEQQIIKGVIFSENEKEKVIKAIDLRNKITHSDFEFNIMYAEKKYFELLAFIISFQSKHFDLEAEDLVGAEKFESLLDIERSRIELLKKTLKRIDEEQIDETLLTTCPNCTEDTFVLENNINTCYLCRHSEPTIECPQCKDIYFESELEDFSDEVDSQYEDGQAIVYNNYGYSEFSACPDCLPKVLENIQNQRDYQEHIWEMERDEHHRRN